jgi:hypothetical protein
MSTSRLVLGPSARSTPAAAESRTQPTRTGTPAGRNPPSTPMNLLNVIFRDRPSGETSGQFRTPTRQLPAMPGSSRDHRPIRPGEHQRARRAPHGVVCTSTSIHHDHRAPVLGFKSKGTGPTSTRIELIRTLRCLRVVKRWQLPRHSASWANAIRHARTYASDAGSTRPACAPPRKSEPTRHEPTPDRHAGRPPAGSRRGASYQER